MKKIVNFGKVDGYGSGCKNCLVQVAIELKENNRGLLVFTASGAVWNSKGTDHIRGGQCLDDLLKYPQLRNNKKYLTIYNLWKKYHLNDMHAGTPEQEKAVKDFFENLKISYDYKKAVEYLKVIGLWEVTLSDGTLYKYGHGWLSQEIPAKDLEVIKALLSE